jgi:peptidyl-prolyl cis-trans isomerase C
MRARVCFGLTALSAVACTVAVRGAFAQAPPAKPASPPLPASVPTPADAAQPMGTVNNEVITKGELRNYLGNYQIPAGSDEQIYQDAMQSLANSHLINQFLIRQRVPVPEEKVTSAIENMKKQLAQDGNDLASEIRRTGMSMDAVRKQFANRIRWVEYMNSRATDAELKKFAVAHKDLLGGTQVKVSHIYLKLEPKASAEEKEKVRQKLVGIKKDIETNKMTFAEAANKYSEDPANSEGAGGDIGYMTLNSGFIEEFTTAAFAMKKGAISDPVETPYGLHLIQVTDRKEGTPVDFEQNKPLVKQLYSMDLQKTVLASERKKAKIDIKPMPADLFPPAPVPFKPAGTPPATTKPGTAK